MFRTRLFKTLKLQFKIFCLTTPMQGFKFIYLPRTTLLERSFWVVTLILSIIVTFIIMFIWKYQIDEDPTVLVSDSINYEIFKFSFPAVTVCPFNKIFKTSTIREAEKMPNKMNYTVNEIAELLVLLNSLYFYKFTRLSKRENDKILQLSHLLDNNNLDSAKLLRDLSPPCNKIIEKCKWKQDEKTCESLFEKILTSEGICCSFNYYALKNDSSEIPRAPKDARRVSASGSQTSLEVIVNTKPEEYTVSELLSYGSKIIIHNAYNYPDWSQPTFLLGMKTLAHIEGNPTVTIASDDLRAIDVQKRYCLFDDEFPLYNFRNYSYQNCLVECRMNLSYYYCGCIPIAYFNQADDSIVRRICTLRDITCLAEHKTLTSSSLPGLTWKDLEKDSGSFKVDTCSCLPDCNLEEYNFRITEATLNGKFSSFQNKWSTNITLRDHSLFRVFFNNLVGTRNRRSLRMNWQSYLAFYGGVLGFFIGFSFILGIELIYLFTVKLIMELLRRQKYYNMKMRKTKPPNNKMKQNENNSTNRFEKILPQSWYLP